LVVRLGVNALASYFPEDLKENAFICEVPAWVSTADLVIPIVLSTCCGRFTIPVTLGRLGGGDLEMWLVSVWVGFTQFSLVTETTPRHVPS